MRRLFLACVVAGALVGCHPAPPTLSPAGVVAFHETQVIKVIDLLRDFAVDANAQTPPLVDTATTRKIVTWHRTALLAIRSQQQGWKGLVSVGLDTLSREAEADVRAKLTPYVTVIRAVLEGV